jgi:hypothetical protein
MKRVKLHNGAILQFPDKTSEDVIKATVKRVLGVKEGPVIEDILNQLSSSLTERDSVDHYGPAVKNQVKTLSKLTDQIVNAINKIDLKTKDVTPALDKQTTALGKFIDIFTRIKNQDRKDLEKVNKDLIRQLSNVTYQIGVLGGRLEKNNALLTNAIDSNTASIAKLVTECKSNTNAVLNLGAIMKAPKTITRDKDGRPTGIKT